MNKQKRILSLIIVATMGLHAFAQMDDNNISAGFFDSSKEKGINFSEFHLPPLAVLFENAKSTPQIIDLVKAQQLAEAEVAKQTPYLFLPDGTRQL